MLKWSWKEAICSNDIMLMVLERLKFVMFTHVNVSLSHGGGSDQLVGTCPAPDPFNSSVNYAH